MFARAAVCNVFLVAKVFYMLQVLSMSRVCVQKLHRIFAVFIWISTWERTSRLNLFHKVKKGGLGLSHLFLKQIVLRFFYLRDQSDGFLRAVIQVRLRDELPGYIVSACGSQRRAVKGFLKEVVYAFQFLVVHFSLDYLALVTKKQLYKDLVDIMCPVPLYRAIYVLGRESDVLKRVNRMPIRSSTKTFFFMLHTGTLPVKPWLKTKGFYLPWGVNCMICKKAETIEHIFLDCSDSVFLWDVLQRTIKKDFQLTPFGIRYLPCEETEGVPCDLIMLITMHSVWKTRMDIRNEHEDAKPAKVYLHEYLLYVRSVLRELPEPPDWLPVMEKLLTAKYY